MIISRTPLRISFLGGGTDLPSYYRSRAGSVVSAAIDKYIYVTVNPKFDERIRASYSTTEMVDSPEQLKHELIRSSLLKLGILGGIEITSISDVPSRGTGLGSSSTYTVGLLNALHASLGRHASAERLAREACEVELEMCNKPIGKQDQYIAAFGGLQQIRFNPDGSVYVDPVVSESGFTRELASHLLLMYTGVTRPASGILEEQSKNTEVDPSIRRSLDRLADLADRCVEALRNKDLHAFGYLLHDGWMEKRKLASGISTRAIDDWYSSARKAGAYGGKLLGAGGGGFLLLCAPPRSSRQYRGGPA